MSIAILGEDSLIDMDEAFSFDIKKRVFLNNGEKEKEKEVEKGAGLGPESCIGSSDNGKGSERNTESGGRREISDNRDKYDNQRNHGNVEKEKIAAPMTRVREEPSTADGMEGTGRGDTSPEKKKRKGDTLEVVRENVSENTHGNGQIVDVGVKVPVPVPKETSIETYEMLLRKIDDELDTYRTIVDVESYMALKSGLCPGHISLMSHKIVLLHRKLALQREKRRKMSPENFET